MNKDQAQKHRDRMATMQVRSPVTCHRRISEDRPDLANFLHNYGWLKQHRQMPEPGGYYDQTARYVAAMGVIGAILGAAPDANDD